ncbi:unnamed protein product, partial [marine sediment metagenome]
DMVMTVERQAKTLNEPSSCASSYSLDTCDQVGKNTGIGRDGQGILPWEYGAQRKLPGFSHAEIKHVLSDSLSACGRLMEAEAVGACGDMFRVGFCDGCGREVGFPITCDFRLCPDCNARRAAILCSEHGDMLRAIHYPKMVTLTFKSVRYLDKPYFKKCRQQFTKLRHRKVFGTCWGGIYAFEVTHNLRFGWHVHIHAIIGSGWIDQALLSREWQEITGCRVVDIRAIKNEDKWDGIREVIKYPAKAATFMHDSALVNEFLKATQGVNLAYGFGALYRVRSSRHSRETMRCPVCGSHDIDFAHGYGFRVARDRVLKVQKGYIHIPASRAPPGRGLLNGQV